MFEIDIDEDFNPDYKERDCLAGLVEFTQKCRPGRDRVAALFGLRRTGKTVLMKQLGHKFGKERTKMYGCQATDNLAALCEQMEKDRASGVKLFLLDEITNLPDFIDFSARLSDQMAGKNINIILSGTDSFGIEMSSHRQLYDRIDLFKTTHIPFPEHKRIMGSGDIDEYFKYGGLLKDPQSAYFVKNKLDSEEYIGTAVADNIANTLAKTAHTDEYAELASCTSRDLKKAISKLVEKYCGKILKKIIQNPIINTSLNQAIEKSADKWGSHEYEAVIRNKPALNEDFAKKLQVNEPHPAPVTDEFINQLKDCLTKTGFFGVIPSFTLRESDGAWRKSLDDMVHIVQPALKYSHLQAGAIELLENDNLNALSKHERRSLAEKFTQLVLGEMAEVSVLYDTKTYLSGSGFHAGKIKFYPEVSPEGEFDMIVWGEASYYAFEIKHSTEALPELQAKHLSNSEFQRAASHYFGQQIAQAVLYSGETKAVGRDVLYINIEDFLGCLDRYRDISLAMSKLQEMGNSEQATLDTVARVDDPDAPGTVRGAGRSVVPQKRGKGGGAEI